MSDSCQCSELAGHVAHLSKLVIALKARELWTRQHGVVVFQKIPVGEIAAYTGFSVPDVICALRSDSHFDRFVTPQPDGTNQISYAYNLLCESEVSRG